MRVARGFGNADYVSVTNRRHGVGDNGDSEDNDAENSQDEFHRLVGVPHPSTATSSSEQPPRRRLARPSSQLALLGCTAIPYPLILVLTMAMALSVGLSIWGNSRRLVARTSRSCSDSRDVDQETASEGPTFVFTAGLEGTGHHFLNALIRVSPSVQRLNKYPEVLRRLGHVRTAFMNGIMMPFFGMPSENDPFVVYRNLTESLRQAHDLLRESSDIRFVPVNALTGWGQNHMLSYPDSHRLLHPNLDVFYAACREAGVRCGTVYLHRDPYAVLRSTFQRRYYRSLPEGAHRYTLMLQALYAQLAYAPPQTLACLGLYRDENATSIAEDDNNDSDEWDPRPLIRDMFGWSSDPAAFDRLWAAVLANASGRHNASLLLQPSDRVHVDATVRAHDRVLQLCRRQVYANPGVYCG